MVNALIVAAGKGTRMGPLVDKLFLEINVKIRAIGWSSSDQESSVGSAQAQKHPSSSAQKIYLQEIKMSRKRNYE